MTVLLHTAADYFVYSHPDVFLPDNVQVVCHRLIYDASCPVRCLFYFISLKMSIFKQKNAFFCGMNKNFFLLGVVCLMTLLVTPSCKSGQASCPAYGQFGDSVNKDGNGAGIPKTRKAKSGIYRKGKLF